MRPHIHLILDVAVGGKMHSPEPHFSISLHIKSIYHLGELTPFKRLENSLCVATSSSASVAECRMVVLIKAVLIELGPVHDFWIAIGQCGAYFISCPSLRGCAKDIITWKEDAKHNCCKNSDCRASLTLCQHDDCYETYTSSPEAIILHPNNTLEMKVICWTAVFMVGDSEVSLKSSCY